MAKPWLSPAAPSAESAHQVLMFQDAHGRRMPVTVTMDGQAFVLQVGANPTMTLTLSRQGAEQLGQKLLEMTGGWRHVDQAAPESVAANNAAIDAIEADLREAGWIAEDASTGPTPDRHPRESGDPEPRTDLVRACTLILAEIERLDRAATASASHPHRHPRESGDPGGWPRACALCGTPVTLFEAWTEPDGQIIHDWCRPSELDPTHDR
jgi:hypothetical protein